MRPEIITFDCYGTLIDWDGGIGGAFRGIIDSHGLDTRLEDALESYHRFEPEVQAEAFRPYREVLTEAARRVGEEFGWRVDDGVYGSLAASLPSWTPFEDTNSALEHLHDAGIRLGILSNIDDDLIAKTREHFTVPFEIVITAQQVGSYKPAHGHFLEARRRIGSRPWLHSAQSWFHDIVPARELGIPAAWVNRLGEAGGTPRPMIEVGTMAELAERVVGQA